MRTARVMSGRGVRRKGLASGFNKREKQAIFTSVCVLVAIGGVIAALFQQDRIRALAFTAAFGITALVLVRSEWRRWGPPGLISPLSLYSVFWFLYYGVLDIGAYGQPTVDDLINFHEGELLQASGLAFLSILLLSIAFRFVTRFGQHQLVISQPEPRAIRPWVVYSCLMVGWAATAYSFGRGQFGYISNGAVYSGLTNHLLVAAVGLVQVGLVALAWAAWSENGFTNLKREHAKSLLILNLPLLVLVSLASGFKAELITELIPVSAIYIILRRRIPWKAIVLVTLYLVLTYAGIQQFRGQISSNGLSTSQTHGLVNAGRTVLNDVTHSVPTANPIAGIRLFWHHFTTEESGASSNIATILYDTPRYVPYVSASRFIGGPIFFVPLSSLPDGSFNPYTYVNVVYLHATANSAAFDSQPGDFYMSGGLPTVLLGELLVGMVLGIVWRYTMALSSTAINRILLYATITGALANAGLDWGTLTRFIAQTIVVFGLVFWFAVPRSRQTLRADPQLLSTR